MAVFSEIRRIHAAPPNHDASRRLGSRCQLLQLMASLAWHSCPACNRFWPIPGACIRLLRMASLLDGLGQAFRTQAVHLIDISAASGPHDARPHRRHLQSGVCAVGFPLLVAWPFSVLGPLVHRHDMFALHRFLPHNMRAQVAMKPRLQIC